MIPAAIKELDTWLREIQTFIRTGGETTSRVALHEVATGERVVTNGIWGYVESVQSLQPAYMSIQLYEGSANVRAFFIAAGLLSAVLMI